MYNIYTMHIKNYDNSSLNGISDLQKLFYGFLSI